MAFEEQAIVPFREQRFLLAAEPVGQFTLHRRHEPVEVPGQVGHLGRTGRADGLDGVSRRRGADDQAQPPDGLCNAPVNDERDQQHHGHAGKDDGQAAVGKLVCS